MIKLSLKKLLLMKMKGGKKVAKKEEQLKEKMKNAEAAGNIDEADADKNSEACCEQDNKEADDVKETENDQSVSQDEKPEDTKKDKKDLVIEELTDKYKRTFAEFDNFRKRTEKEKAAMFEVGAKAVVEKILPIVDSFERGLATVPEKEKESPFADGMNKVYRQFMTALEEAGVKPIEALNSQFDPNLHNAVMHVEDDSVEENIVIEELQKGYTYRDTVVRHSMVKVAN